MALMDRVKAFFNKEPKSRDLSSSVVTHDRVDDSYLEDFRSRATKFEQVFENAPNVPVGAIPDKCPSCGHESEDANWFRHEGDKLMCDSCEHELAMPEAPYSLWPDLVSDTFRSYFTYSDPRIKQPGEIKQSHELHRRIMARSITSEEFMDTRPMTRMNDLESAWAAMAMTHSLRDSIREGALAEHARRAEGMAQEESKIEDAERQLEDLREKWENKDLSDEERERLRELAAEHDQASGALDTLVQDAQANPINLDVLEAIDEALEQAEEDAELMASMPGVGGSDAGTMLNPDTMFKLAEKWRENDILRKVAELMGRLERDMRYRRANRVVGGFEEIVDVELGDQIHHALPHELMKLKSPLLRKQFQRQFVEKSLQQYELRGNEPEGKGPVVILVDGSGSMSGPRNVWARAVGLALVNIAHKERRDAAVIEFSHAGATRTWFFGGRESLDPEQIIECAAHFYGGGTDIGPAVAEGLEIMERVPEFRKADLCIITDGEDYYGATDEELKQRLLSKGIRTHGIAIAEGLGYLKQMCEHVTKVTDVTMDNANEATTALAVNIS